MGKKQTTGSDPFAEFGGAAIMQEADPFAEFGGSAIEQQPPFPQAPTQQAPAPAGSAGAPVGASPSTSAHGTGAATAAPPVPTTYELPTPQEEAEIQRGYDAGLVSPEELRTQGFEARARGLEAQQGERERTRAADIFSSLDESGLAEYKKQMEERQAALKQESVKLQAQAASLEKAASQQLSQEEADFMRAEQKTLRERAYAIAAEARDLDTDKRLAAKRDYEIKSGQGSVWGATWNNLLGSVGGAVSGLNAPIASAMAEAMPAKPKEGETQDQANRRMVNSLRQAMRGAPKEMIGDSETTDEYIAEMQKGFLSGPWLAVTSTVPLAALGPAGTGMMLSAADNVMREVEDDPSFENIPEWKKYTVAYTIGAITGQLEKAGFRGAVTGSGVVKRILNKAIDRMPAGATEAQVRAILNQETKSAIANMSGRLASSMAEEAFTEGVQAGVEPAMKDIFNAIEEKNLMPRADGSKGFETPNGFSGYVTDMFENAKVGALGGAIMGTPVAVWKMTKEASLGKNTNDAQFQAISDMLNDPDMQDVLMNDIRDQVASGTMSAAKAREIEASWKQAKSILYRIPKGLSQEARREAYDLLAKKDELSLVDKSMASGEVEAIDQQLAELVKKDAIARAEADRVVTTLPPSLENVSLSQEENDRIAAARAELGIEFDALEGLTDGMVMTFNRVENDLPTSPSAIDEVSGFLYAKYKELQAMKQAPKGVLTIDQIDSLMEQLGSDIELLETYKQKQREQAEGITGAQTQSQGSANAGTDTQAAQEGGSDGRQRQVVAQPAIQEPASKVEKPAQEVPAAQPKVEPVAAQERAQDPIGGLAPEAITELDDVLGVAETPPAVSPEGPVRPDGPTPQAMRKQGSDGRRTPGISADNVRKALAQEAPDIKIVTHTRLEDYRAAIDAYNKANNTKADPSASVAVYLPGTNEIHLSPSADGRSLAHEAAHPIVSALIERKPELFDRLYEEVLADPAAKEAVDFGKLYSDADQTTVKAETLVRFMDAVASGKIKVSTDPKSAWQRFKAWLSDILARIGFGPKDIDLSNPANVREFAAMFSKAVNEGIEIRKIRGERGGVNAGPMMQRDEAFNGIEQPKTPIGDTKTVMVDGKERTVFNSEGRPIHPTVEGVRNFWRWFGDSKVVDEQGRPLVVYHGTSEKFDTFKKGTIHLSDNERVAYSYARGYLGTGVGDVMSVYVRIQKPADVRSVSGIRKVADKAGVLLDDDRIHDPESLYEDADTLSSEGYDGIIANHQMSLGINDGTSEYIVFDSELVKSATGNYGTFDPSRANINEQRRSPSEVAATFAKHGLSPEQAAAYMRQRGVSDDFAQQVVAEMRPKEEAKTPPPEPKKPERRKRATTQKLVEAFPSLGPALTENMVFYDRLPNDVTQAAAEALIDEHGVDGAAAAVLDQTSPMSPPVRMLLGGIVMDRLHKAGEIDKLIEFGDKFLTSPTEYGQAIQILNALYRNYWSPEVAVRKSVRDIQRDRSKKYKRHKKTIDKLKKGLKDINAKAAEEAIKELDVRNRTNKAASAGQADAEPKAYGARNKVFTRKKYEDALKNLRGKLMSGVPPELVEVIGFHLEAGTHEFADIAKKLVRSLGKKVLPYLKGAYTEAAKQAKAAGLEFRESSEASIDEYIFKSNSDKAVERLRKAIERKSKKEADAAIAELQQIAKDHGIWGQYKKEAIDRLRRMQLQDIKQDIAEDPALKEFTDSLVRNLTAQAKESAEEAGREKPEPKKPRPAIEVIADAYKNFERYQEVWEETRRQMQGAYFAAQARMAKAESEEARAEASEAVARERAKLERLDAYYGEVGPKPFAESVMASAVKQGMKALDQKIADIIRKHYTEYDAKRRALQDRLVSEAGLDGKEAQELADAVGREFDRIATEAKRKLMRSVLPKAATNKTKRKNKAIEDELVALTNAGAFSDDDFIKAYGDKMGWPKLTRENIAEIERLAERIQTVPEGRPRNEAIQDLLGYQMSIPGIDLSEIVQSVWYANMLSGHETQEANVLANLYNFTTQAFIVIGQATTNEDARRAIPGLFRAIIDGVNSGRLEFRAVWSTGYNPIRGQIEAPSTAERKKFTPLKVGPIDVNPLNKVKYVRRFMVAVDSIYYEAARSMRAYQMAVKMASDEKKLNPSLDVRNRAAEIIGKTNDAIQQAVEQADSEYAAEVEAIRSGSMPEAQRKKLLQKAARDRRRRVFELTEKKRPEPLVVASADFAKRLTYNHKPEGVLGFMAELVNLLGQRYPGFRYVVPFTNVIANVANETVNYTPLGYIKAYHEGGVFTKREEWTDDQRRDMMWKATMGTMMMVAMYMLSHPEDEDDKPWVQVTANGFGDYRRNEVLRDTGWRPYSIRFGDGPWIIYKYSPLILALAFIGNANDFVKYRKKKLTDTRLTKWSSALGWTTLAFLDQTYLSSLNNLLSAMMDPRNEDRADDVARTALRIAKTAVIPNLYTQGSKAVMDWAEMPEKEIRGTTLGFLLKDVPVFRGMYQDAVNVLGDPLVPQAGRFISLSDNSDEVANFLADRGIELSAPHPNTLLYDTGDGDRVFTPEMQHKFYVERGKYIKARILSRMDNLRGMEKEKAAEVVAKIAAKATNIAKKKATGLAPD